MNLSFNIKELFNKLIRSSTVINVLIVGAITVLVKGFGFYKEVVIAGEFGLSELLDTFYIAALVPGFINQVFLSAFKSVFIPNYIAEEKTNKKIGAFQATSFVVTIGTALFFMLISYLITDTFLEVFFKGHTEGYYHLVKAQFYYLLPCILIWGLTSLLSGLLNIYNEFTYSTIYPIFTSITVIVCLMFFREQLGEVVLAVGMLIGSFIQLLFLLIVAIYKKIIAISAPDFSSVNAIVMFKQLPAKISSGFLTGLIPVTDQYFAAQLVIGSIAALNYGFKIPAFFTTIVVIAFGNVLLPYFSKLNIDNSKEAFKNLFYTLKITFISVFIIVLIVCFFSSDIVRLIFERDSFTADDTDIVSKIQVVYLIGIPFAICGNMFVKFLTSINKNAFMAYVSLGSMLLNIILDFIFMKYYGVIGIAVCTTLIHITKLYVFYNYTNKQKKILVN